MVMWICDKLINNEHTFLILIEPVPPHSRSRITVTSGNDEIIVGNDMALWSQHVCFGDAYCGGCNNCALRQVIDVAEHQQRRPPSYLMSPDHSLSYKQYVKHVVCSTNSDRTDAMIFLERGAPPLYVQWWNEEAPLVSFQFVRETINLFSQQSLIFFPSEKKKTTWLIFFPSIKKTWLIFSKLT